MVPIEMDAKDNLLTAKIDQVQLANHHRSPQFPFRVGERVMLSMAHRRMQYKSDDGCRVAKFMPCYDGPYKITSTNEKHSTVALSLPHNPQAFPVFHTSEIQPFHENNNNLFPEHALQPPAPLTIDGEQEFFIEKIIDECKRHNKTQ